MTRGEMESNARSSGASIVSSPFLEPLTDHLAQQMGIVPADPFVGDLIVVPNVGVRDWLQRELCTRLEGGSSGSRAGIVANVRFMFVQQFVDTVFEASATDVPPAWDIDHLTWVVHRAIDVIGRPSIPGAAHKPLTVARVVADLFDRYGVHRPSMLRYWKAGRAVDGVEPLQDLPRHLQWQQRLYTEVCRLIPDDAPADRIAGLGDRIRESGMSDLVPAKVSLFGFVTMNTTVRLVLAAVSQVRAVDVYLVHPTPHGMSRSPALRSGHDARDHVVVAETGNPLLSRWGRSILEMDQLLTNPWTDVEWSPQPRGTDLDRLRRSIVEDQPMDLVPIHEGDERLARGDGSIQIHACHGRVRQVEVLRDALLHLMEDDPTLTLSDISIQCPDLVAFAPIIPAVFASGRSAGEGPPALDVSIADRVLLGENPYHDAFWSILDLARSRCGVGEMLTILAASPVQRRFSLDEEELARVSDWVDRLAVRFGLDQEHRRTWNVPDSITAGTWESALDRLFMGMAVPAETPFLGPGEVVPFDDVSVSDGPILARLAEFLVALRRLVADLSADHSVAEWARILEGVIDSFFDVSEAQEFACRDVHDAIHRLAEAALSAGIEDVATFSFDEVSPILRDLMSSARMRPRFRSGAITVTDLLPQQGVPYRVIALLGASEAMFASSGTRGDDVLSLRPCVGDPMPTTAGRLQFLDLVLAARDAVIITCDGADINNNKAIPLPVPIQEFVEATLSAIDTAQPADVGEAKATQRQCRLLTRHPRQSFAAPSVSPGLFRQDRSFTFDPVALEIHSLRGRPPAPVLAGRRENTPPSPKAAHVRRVTTHGLRRVVGRPVDYFVQDVLGMRLPMSDARARHDFLDFWPTSLDYARSGREILDAVLRSADVPHEVIDRSLTQMKLGGVFPPGRLGDKSAALLASEVTSIVELLPPEARRFQDYRSIDIDDLLLPGSQTDVLTGNVERVLGFDVMRASFTKFREDLVLEPWIDLAVLTFLDPEHSWTVQMVGRGAKGEGVARAFGLAGSDASGRRASAQRAIDTALTLMDHMTQGRVPYVPRTAERLARASVAAAQDVYEKEGDYSATVQFLFGKVTWDDFLTETVREGDPVGRGDSRAERFADFVWDAFDATTVPRAPGSTSS